MEPDYKSIYLFNLQTWEKKYITKGFSPILLGQDIVYWTPRKSYDKDSLEQVHLFNLDSKSDRIIFCVPDSLSLWESGGDYRDPGRIESGNSSSKDQFILNLSYRDESLDRYRIIKTLNLNGALINEKIKDLCSGCN